MNIYQINEYKYMKELLMDGEIINGKQLSKKYDYLTAKKLR